jgi:hypothetical protein
MAANEPVIALVRLESICVPKTVNGIFVCIFIKFTSTPGRYVLLVNGRGVTPATTSLVPVTLIIGDNGGSTQMNRLRLPPFAIAHWVKSTALGLCGPTLD